MVQAVKRFNSISRARLNFRRRPILSAILYRNPIHAKLRWHIWPTFLWNFLCGFHRRCLSTISIPWCKTVKNDQKLKSRGVPALKTYIAHCAVHWRPNDHEAKNLQSNSRERFFFFFFNIAGKHERLYCWLSHLHTIAQGRHETAGICFLSWFCYDISVKEKKKERKKTSAKTNLPNIRMFV